MVDVRILVDIGV